MPDNTVVPYTGLIDSEHGGGWTAGGNFAPGLAIKTVFQYNVAQIGSSWFYIRTAYNGQDSATVTVGPYPDSNTAIIRMNDAKVMDGTS